MLSSWLNSRKLIRQVVLCTMSLCPAVANWFFRFDQKVRHAYQTLRAGLRSFKTDFDAKEGRLLVQWTDRFYLVLGFIDFCCES